MHALRIALLAALLALVAVAPPAAAKSKRPPADPTATGTGGAVASVDPYATKAGMDILRRGGNAVDAAVAAASVLGVVEPYSSGIGGGGFMVIRSRTGDVTTIDGRETAPAAFPEDAFIDPNTGQPYPGSMFGELATSGLSVGVPGTVRTWELALERYGTFSLRQLMRRSIKLAKNGFVVDPTFAAQTEANLNRFNDFTSTRETYTVDGEAPEPGTIHRNPDMADTLRAIAKEGGSALHTGPIAQDVVEAVQDPPLVEGSDRNARPGHMTLEDLAGYEAKWRPPTQIEYGDLEVFGMGPPSSGGSTVGEALNILEEVSAESEVERLHQYLEASKLSFADRGAYLGDSDFVDVPLAALLSQEYACERAQLITDTALPVQQAGDADPNCEAQSARSGEERGGEGLSTTHLTVADRWGNVVSYTLTIEQTGGSGIVVPDRGFLLNNELTDFDFATGRANSPAGGKRPRSSMSPTIVLRDGAPFLALGSPGGSTIITTVLQILLNRIDFGMSLPDAIAAPRASQRNTASVSAEPAFVSSEEGQALAGDPWRHSFARGGEIGAATAIEFLGGGRVLAAAEPERRGGGSAAAEDGKGGRKQPGKRRGRR